MKRYRFDDMKLGYFVGDFTPTAFRTTACEVAYKIHRAHEPWPKHYQRTATEINLLIHGMMKIGRTILHAGEIFVIAPKEAIQPIFLTRCEIICVKVPSDPTDKVVCR